MDKWEDKVAVVTGASSGIGLATAILLAQNGMRVAALARREDRLKELEETFKSRGFIKGYKCDVSVVSDIEETFEKIRQEMGKISVLVNNAGVSHNTDILDFEMDRWRQMFDVNVFGMFHCIKEVIGEKKINNDMEPIHIINISSIVGHNFPADTSIQVYSSTKFVVTLLTRGLLKTVAANNLPNIKITSLSPGIVETEIFEVGQWKRFNVKSHPHLSPEDIAKAILHVISLPPNAVVSELTIKPAGEVLM